MIELAQKAAAVMEPLSVPLMIAIAFGVWKVERRVLALEFIIKLSHKEHSNVTVEKSSLASTPAKRRAFGTFRTRSPDESEKAGGTA